MSVLFLRSIGGLKSFFRHGDLFRLWTKAIFTDELEVTEKAKRFGILSDDETQRLSKTL